MPIHPRKVSCSAAIINAVKKEGALSRAAITTIATLSGHHATSRVAGILKKLIAQGMLHNKRGFYQLGKEAIHTMLNTPAFEVYSMALEEAERIRNNKQEARALGKSNAEKGYASRLEAAGGLSQRALSDQVWIASHA